MAASKLDAAGATLVYSTYLGGSSTDNGNGIAVDGAGNAYTTGYTYSPNFPSTPGAYQTAYAGSGDAFIVKLNTAGSTLIYSTYLGGSNTDYGSGIAVDGAGNTYVTGFTGSTNFPTTPGAFQTASAGGGDAFAARFASVPPSTPDDIDPAPNAVVENAPTGTYVGLTASSTDPEGGSITYGLTGDSSGGGFQIDPATGRVMVADGSKILYNASPSHTYQVTVLATATDGLAASQTFSIAVTTHNQAFINQLYINLLNRAADSGGLAYWDAQLAAGLPRSQVAIEIERTLEYAQRTVAGLYTRYLHRAGDAGGVSYFAQLMLQGVTVEQVAAVLIGSDEFFTVQGGGTSNGFLNALYQDALGRPIDSGGLAWWNSVLAIGVPRSQVAALVLATAEYRQGVVQAAYQQLLGRAADPGGLTYWTNALNAGATDQQLNAALAGSEEYYARSA